MTTSTPITQPGSFVKIKLTVKDWIIVLLIADLDVDSYLHSKHYDPVHSDERTLTFNLNDPDGHAIDIAVGRACDAGVIDLIDYADIEADPQHFHSLT